MSTLYRNWRIVAAAALVLFLQRGAVAETKVEGTAEALRVETTDSIQEVLTSLRDALNIEYRTSIELSQPISGTYRGSLSRVLGRVLDGYDFVLKNSDEKMELVVLGRKGTAATSQPTGNPGASTDQSASSKSTNPPSADKGKAASGLGSAQQKQQASVPSMLTVLAEQQLPSGANYPRSTPAASAPSSSNSSSTAPANPSSGAGTVPSQAEIAALTQQAATKLEALRSSLQRVGR